ncbi:MAG: L,D-transpeptidase family protein [Sulfurospirillaceae bacterium]|nr:L,D-transpeptidase family protein [Sulfurospirillaceae bacterium]
MRYFVVLSLLLVVLYANKVVTAEDVYAIYKSKGIKAVEDYLIKEFQAKEIAKAKETKAKELKVEKKERVVLKSLDDITPKEAQSKDFWSKYLKDKNVQYGYYENLNTLLICEKEKKRLEVYKNGEDGIKFVKAHDVIVGKNGDKLKEGDLKTPVGVYEITRRFKPSDQFYGPLAFSLSYPNVYDKLRGKNGNGIWIHGSPLDGGPRGESSKGCIVMDNPIITSLDTEIDPKSALTIIGEDEIPKTSKESLAIILSEFYKWQHAWKGHDANKYLAFYSDNFIRFDGMKKSDFSKMKKRIFSKKEKKEIKFKDVNISPYPSLDGRKLFKISFYEIYKSNSFKYNGEKELYVELKKDKLLILAER